MARASSGETPVLVGVPEPAPAAHPGVIRAWDVSDAFGERELGFSDRATVYLNGKALFRGDESYRNRDYRFLGSIGWWDTVYLPLEAGANELVIAVAEDLGVGGCRPGSPPSRPGRGRADGQIARAPA